MNFKKELPEDEQMELLQNKEIPENREKLILHNLRLVMWVVQKYHIPGKTELDDLFQTGTIGLMDAIDKYDPNKGAKFSTVAVWYIRSSITRNMFMFTGGLSLDEPTVEGEDITLQDTIPSKVNVEDEVASKVFIERFKKEFKPRLTELEYSTLVLYYGLGCPEYSTREIASKYNVSMEEVNNARNKGLWKVGRSVFIKGIRKEVDKKTNYYRSIDYTRPKVAGGRMSSPVERIVLERERLFKRLKKRYSIKDV